MVRVDVLVDRLVASYPWWKSMYYAEPNAKQRLRRAKPIPNFVPEGSRDDSIGWNFGRVKHFAKMLKSRQPVTSIRIEGDFPYAFVEDGHHRLAAHVLTGKRTIRARYDGDETMLEFLRGRIARV